MRRASRFGHATTGAPARAIALASVSNGQAMTGYKAHLHMRRFNVTRTKPALVDKT